ncbi:hypothetical protein [Clostridium beijerinckii]|uniref:Uncharacterized protein n=1 Tax=Clostridium beijerinckii TaxID=1520 RepID=A0AAE5H1J5_CLOBE|nr:hypothetical protein [Clostridium beijerinckii]NSB12331.1 hypothetical protein [Clostridium beijerinckii]OOM30785.1 hypothetical protein CLOBE_14630 [Clostridium beijerinckii]
MFELVTEKGWDEGEERIFGINKSINIYNMDNKYFDFNLKC